MSADETHALLGEVRKRYDTLTKELASNPEQRLHVVARLIYIGRMEEAWGARTWSVRDTVWPRTDKEWRAYLHNPSAEVDLALASAKCLLRYMDTQPLLWENIK